MNITQTGLTQQFWTEFVLNNWERECLSIKDSFIHPPITSDELFSVLVNDCNTSDEIYKRSRFYIEGKLQKLEKSSFLWPKKEDKSFAQYEKRIRSTINEQEYALVIDGLKVNGSLWDWTYEFLQNLFNSLGYLSPGHFYSIFYGNYTVTPFGVHNDPNTGAFYFPITGNKSMRTWSPQFVNKNPKLKKSKEYKDFLEGSMLLEAKSGGMLYWPSDRWHVGESKGGDVSIVIAINTSNNFVLYLLDFICDEIQSFYGNSLKIKILKLKIKALIYWPIFYEELKIWCQDSFKKYPVKLILQLCHIILSRLLSIKDYKINTNKTFFNPNDLQKSAETIPESIHLAAIIFKEVVDSLIIKKASIKLWLSMLTCYGFYPISASQFMPLEHELLTLDSYIQVYPKRVILWTKVDDNEIIVSVNGLCLSVPSHPVFPRLINNINSQKLQRVDELIKTSNKIIDENGILESSLEEVLDFLKTLLRFRGIQIVK